MKMSFFIFNDIYCHLNKVQYRDLAFFPPISEISAPQSKHNQPKSIIHVLCEPASEYA